MHEHVHAHGQGSRKQLWWVLLLSFSYMVAEVVAGMAANSLALLADAGHMATDVAAIALGIFAMWMAHKPATAEKTYGYYRVEILAALVNAVALVVISIWIFYEAWQRFNTPAEIRGSLMTFVAVGGLFVNLLAMWLTHSDSQHSLNVRAVWLHLFSDALGSAAAIVAGIAVWQFGWPLADPIMSVLIGVLILLNAWGLLVECVNVLLEGVPKGVDVREIRLALEADSAVVEVHDLHVWTLTSGMPALSVHLKVRDKAEPGPLLKRVTCLLKEKHHIGHVTIQIEPTGYDHAATDQCHS
ncbi:MAG: cation transporter [Bdellovibrionales bacterium]|nr:cation transporter [Bdellovibrionales bacterium]